MATLKDIRLQKRLLKLARQISDNEEADFLVLVGPNTDGKYSLSTNMSREVAVHLISGAFNGKTSTGFQ